MVLFINIHSSERHGNKQVIVQNVRLVHVKYRCWVYFKHHKKTPKKPLRLCVKIIYIEFHMHFEICTECLEKLTM